MRPDDDDPFDPDPLAGWDLPTVLPMVLADPLAPGRRLPAAEVLPASSEGPIRVLLPWELVTCPSLAAARRLAEAWVERVDEEGLAY